MQSAGKNDSEMIDQVQVEKRNPWDLMDCSVLSIAAVTNDQT